MMSWRKICFCGQKNRRPLSYSNGCVGLNFWQYQILNFVMLYIFKSFIVCVQCKNSLEIFLLGESGVPLKGHDLVRKQSKLFTWTVTAWNVLGVARE